VFGLAEIGVGDFADGGGDVEVVLGLEAERPGDEVAGEALALVAIVADVAVEEPPGRLDAVLGIDQLGLELEEMLVRLELRVILHDGQKPLEGNDQPPQLSI